MQFVIRHDAKKIFLFGPLQWTEAQNILGKVSGKILERDTIVLLEEGKVFTESAAVLKIMGKLSGMYRLVYGLIIVPGFLRDAMYRFVARHRYRVFGKRDECMVPTPELRKRFIPEPTEKNISFL